MYEYIAYYARKQIIVTANSSYEAQKKAAKEFGARNSYDVTVMRKDTVHVATF